MSTQAQFLAKNNNYVLTKSRDGDFAILKAKDLEGVPRKLPKFSSDATKSLLLSGGYCRIQSGKCLEYGKKLKLYLFQMEVNGSQQVYWLTEKSFLECFPTTKDLDKRFAEDAANGTWGKMLDVEDGSDESDDDDDIDEVVEQSVEEMSGDHNPAFGQAAHSAGYPSLPSAVEQIGQPAGFSMPIAPAPQVGQPAAFAPSILPAAPAVQPRQPINVQKGLSMHQSSLLNGDGGKIIYARRINKTTIQGIIQKTDGSYDMKVLREGETDMVNKEDPRNTGYVPKGDRKFITRMSCENDKIEGVYKIVGCVGFKRGLQLWKVVILEFPKDYERLIQSFRGESIYEGPVLCPWSSFENGLRGDTGKADTYFEKTTFGFQLAKEGVEPRSVRHKTLEPEGSKPYSESRDLKELGARMDDLEMMFQALLTKRG